MDLNDTYKILEELQDILRERGVKSRLHRVGQTLGRPECLEFDEPQWFDTDPEFACLHRISLGDSPLCIITNGHIKIIRQLLDVPDFKNPLDAATVELYSEDLADPYSIEKIVVFVLSNWAGDANISSHK